MAVAADARQLIHAQPARAHYPACYCRRQCLGRFCQCRFKSQALLDEKAVIAAMACVDLNPIRARMTETPEASGHTAIRRRLRQLKAFDSDAAPEPEPLCPFAGNTCEAMPDGLACPLAGYVELVEWSDRQLHPNDAWRDTRPCSTAARTAPHRAREVDDIDASVRSRTAGLVGRA